MCKNCTYQTPACNKKTDSRVLACVSVEDIMLKIQNLNIFLKFWYEFTVFFTCLYEWSLCGEWYIVSGNLCLKMPEYRAQKLGGQYRQSVQCISWCFNRSYPIICLFATSSEVEYIDTSHFEHLENVNIPYCEHKTLDPMWNLNMRCERFCRGPNGITSLRFQCRFWTSDSTGFLVKLALFCDKFEWNRPPRSFYFIITKLCIAMFISITWC